MIDRQVALSVARMAVQDLLFYTGYMYAFGEAGAPVNLFVDEFYNVVFEGFVDLLKKAGGAGIRATLALQTTSDNRVGGQPGAGAADTGQLQHQDLHAGGGA